MALIKCPECGRENVSDTAKSCPNCGYNIKEYYYKKTIEEKKHINSVRKQDKIEYLKDDLKKIKPRTKVMIGIILLCILCVPAIAPIVNHNNSLFYDSVDEFCENWDKLELELQKEKPDALSVDIDYKVLSGDLRQISKLYEQFKNKDNANQYLESNINQYMFHQVVKYNESSSGHSYEYCKELYEFYKNPTSFQGLEITNIELYKNPDGYIHCKCNVTNNGQYSQRYIQVIIYFKNSNGDVLKYDRCGLIGGNDLEVGNTSELDFNSYIKDGIDSCDMVIDYQ